MGKHRQFVRILLELASFILGAKTYCNRILARKCIDNHGVQPSDESGILPWYPDILTAQSKFLVFLVKSESAAYLNQCLMYAADFLIDLGLRLVCGIKHMGQIDDYLGELLGIKAMGRELKGFKRLVVDRLSSVDVRIKKLEEVIVTLADTIKELVAVEIEDGKKLIEANASLVEALGAASDKVTALEALLADQPALVAELAAVKEELGLASDAAQLISSINPTPISDGVVEAVIEDPAIETPAVVKAAPEPSVETIPELPVVEAAVDSLG